MVKPLVLDASALIAGFQPQDGEYLTVPEVLGEVKDESMRLLLELRVREGALKLREPDEEALLKVKGAASRSGYTALLSLTDTKLLALALSVGGALATDDYDIQNMARELGIPYTPLAEEGIKRILRWKNICKGCGRVYTSKYTEKRCEVCGSALVRVVRKGRRL